MAKFTLEIEDEYPYSVTGINTSLKGYRLAWNLNRLLDIHLERQEPIELVNKQKDRVPYSCFTCFDEERNRKFRLIENRIGGNLFIPEQQRSDFLFVVDLEEGESANEWVTVLRSIKGVSMAFDIEIDTLKSKQNLLLTT